MTHAMVIPRAKSVASEESAYPNFEMISWYSGRLRPFAGDPAGRTSAHLARNGRSLAPITWSTDKAFGRL